MKNKDFFYLQYNKIEWQNQEKTKINFFINEYIIKNIILRKTGDAISVFDIGFGIGFFFKMLSPYLRAKYREVLISGCEPSNLNFKYFKKKIFKNLRQDKNLFVNKTLANTKVKKTFDFITAIYVFPHFLLDDLEATVRKIYSLLDKNGEFVLVLANEKYLQNKLRVETDLFIEESSILYHGKKYKEILHYSDIPKIGKVIDYNREERFYLDLFKNNKFILKSKKNINDNGFICTLFVFKVRK